MFFKAHHTINDRYEKAEIVTIEEGELHETATESDAAALEGLAVGSMRFRRCDPTLRLIVIPANEGVPINLRLI